MAVAEVDQIVHKTVTPQLELTALAVAVARPEIILLMVLQAQLDLILEVVVVME